VQGYIGSLKDTNIHPLCNQLVVGHEEYRRETYAALHFRRAFAEIYRSRIFLFLGAGLEDPYLLELFGEIIELLGSVPHMHYALVPKDALDSDFLLRRPQIRTIEYEVTEKSGHSEQVHRFISSLRDAIESKRPRTVKWSFRLDAGDKAKRRDRKPDVEIIRGNLPNEASEHDAFAVSGRRDRLKLEISKSGRKSLSRMFSLDPLQFEPPENVNASIHKIKGINAYVVVTRVSMVSDVDFRDARNIAPGTKALLERVAADGCTRLHTYPLASGSRRTFPPYFALLEMLRAYRKYFHRALERGLERRVRILIYVENHLVLHLLNSRRIDPLEVLASDEIRFWVEIWRGSELSRVLEAAAGDTRIFDIIKKHDIPLKRWTYSVIPSPTKVLVETQFERLQPDSRVTLESEGVFSGSTLRLRPLSF
jgi:SIR2-like domain